MTPRRVRVPRMRAFQVPVRFYSLRDETTWRELGVTVGTRADLSVLPRAIAEALDVRPEGRRWFRLPDGQLISREFGHAGVEYEERRAPTPVVLGEPQDVPVLGAVALEALGYDVDPFARTLRPRNHHMVRVPRARPPETRPS